METILVAEIVAVVIAIVSFIIAMYFSKTFRTIVFAYMKKQWRENKEWIYAAIDEKICEISKDVDAEISAKTDKYIKQEVLRRAIHNSVDGKAAHSGEWAIREYKIVLEELLKDKE